MPSPPLSATQLAALAGVLPEGTLLTTEADLARYSRDWSGDHFGRPLAVARPASVEDVSALMRSAMPNASRSCRKAA